MPWNKPDVEIDSCKKIDSCNDSYNYKAFSRASHPFESLYFLSFFSSPRWRSRTPDSSEKVKRNVHFQDESTTQQSGTDDGDSETAGKQDQRQIMHSDGKVVTSVA